MKTGRTWFFAGLTALVMAGFVIVGCDSTKTTDNLITITPASIILTNDWETVVFTASFSGTNATLTLPLQWSVSNPERGTITASGAMTAIYEGGRVGGENIVTVKDQGDNEGAAIVVRR